jgi:hypothetical protein
MNEKRVDTMAMVHIAGDEIKTEYIDYGWKVEE